MDPLWLSTTNVSTIKHNNETIKSSSFNDISQLEILDRPTRTSLVILYSTTSVLALVGNVLVIIVETFGRRSAPSLRKFLINLAISDILFGVFAVPFTYADFMFGRWIFFPWLCPWAQFIQILSIFITSFTLTVISIERYYAIKFPLSNQNKWLTMKSQYILLIGWILGILWAWIPHTKIEEFVWDNQTYLDCRPDHELYQSRWYNISSVMLTFGLPLIIQSICYASVIRCLLCKNNQIQSSQSTEKHNRDMTRIIRMLVAVVILFLICWLPIKILMTVITYSPEWLFISDPQSNNFYIASYFICHWMAMSNSFVNPIIYSFMSKSFRIDLQELIRKICGKKIIMVKKKNFQNYYFTASKSLYSNNGAGNANGAGNNSNGNGAVTGDNGSDSIKEGNGNRIKRALTYTTSNNISNFSSSIGSIGSGNNNCSRSNSGSIISNTNNNNNNHRQHNYRKNHHHHHHHQHKHHKHHNNCCCCSIIQKSASTSSTSSASSSGSTASTSAFHYHHNNHHQQQQQQQKKNNHQKLEPIYSSISIISK